MYLNTFVINFLFKFFLLSFLWLTKYTISGLPPTTTFSSPLIIAHRGAPGYLPEATLAAYELAIDLGADYIEVDLVSTRDGHLIASHDVDLAYITDIAERPEFSKYRRANFTLDGILHERGGFLAVDLDLEQVKALRVHQHYPYRPQIFNGKFGLATLDEIFALVARKNSSVGLHLELKHPTFHRQQSNLSIEDLFIRKLQENLQQFPSERIIVQCFEPTTLKQIAAANLNVTLVQCIDSGPPPSHQPYDWTLAEEEEASLSSSPTSVPQSSLTSRTFRYMTTDEGLSEIALYAHGICPYKQYIFNASASAVDATSDLIVRAHARKLVVQAFTFRNDDAQQQRCVSPTIYAAAAVAAATTTSFGAVQELLTFMELGVDGVFTDFTDTALAVRKLYQIASDNTDIETA